MKYLAALALAGALLLSSACTQSSQKLVEAGNRYHNAKKYKEASILYQKALTKDKTNAEAYYREGLNLLDMGQVQQAVSFLRRAVDLKPTNTDAASKLAEIYLIAYTQHPQQFKTTLLPEIEELVKTVSKYQPNSFSGLRLQGLLALAKNDPERALDAFSKANALKPYSPDVVTWYAETLYNQKQVDQAVALVRNMLAHDKKWGPGYDFLFVVYSRDPDKEKGKAEAKAILEERVQNDPKNAVAIVNLANFDSLTGNYNEAESIIKRVLADPKAFPNGHEIVGDFYFRNKRYDQAMQQYQAGLQDDSKNALAYQERMVDLYQQTNRHEDALNLARTLVKDYPKNVNVNQMYASLLLQAGSLNAIAKSVSELKDLVKANPTDPLLHLDLGRAYYETNDRDKSLSEAQEAEQDEIKQARAAVPAHPPRTPVLIAARVLIGRVYADRNQFAKAIDEANAVLQSDPRNADARLIKDRGLVGIGQADAALPDLEALVQQYPNNAGAQLELANVYLAHKLSLIHISEPTRP